MSDLYALLDALDHANSAKTDTVLATVVKVDGSAYRRPGARMLIPLYGRTVGTISGGCLEQELARKAWWLTESGEAVVRRYSTAAQEDEEADDEDAALTFGLGCNGTVHVLLERHAAGKQSLLLDMLQRVKASGQPAALATVIAAGRKSRVRIGARMGLNAFMNACEGIHCQALQHTLRSDLHSTLERKKSRLMIYGSGADEVEVFLEYLAPQRRLVIFGAGHDAQPLVRFARDLNWQVTVVDGRAHFARPERFPGAHQVIVAPINEPFNLSSVVDGAAVVVMTHSFRQDRHWLENVLHCSPAYVGQLGPRERTERLLEEIGAPGVLPGLHYPAGLDLGGDTPASVALAIVGEITAYLNKRSGGMLKHRKTTIHEATEATHSGSWAPSLTVPSA
ncbi:XdhC family protein [Pseudomonas fluorescens]|uniref:Putative xanthine dehydrogenase subunit A n=1 Tax=Pseudomonas fluorescens TaxID=294 RepID=A0A5E7UTN0_PSEFL|nr:XdhC/CoxI family protein [Pseudomonas fluorescens]VVO13478.1 putative xanthine dehydrogenase subunit A [Pseudomonas fluorescens]VVQ13850.1 putative xanthine dehydrogenase subunit A [Pseudomonas fluorescens]